LNRFIKISGNHNRRKVCLAAGCHGIVVHGIAQAAIFGDRLFGLYIAVMRCKSVYSNPVTMSVRIYHILPRDEAKEQ